MDDVGLISAPLSRQAKPMRRAATLIPSQKVTVSHFWGAPSFLSSSLVSSRVHKETRKGAAKRKCGAFFWKTVFWLLQSSHFMFFKGLNFDISLIFSFSSLIFSVFDARWNVRDFDLLINTFPTFLYVSSTKVTRTITVIYRKIKHKLIQENWYTSSTLITLIRIPNINVFTYVIHIVQKLIKIRSLSDPKPVRIFMHGDANHG